VCWRQEWWMKWLSSYCLLLCSSALPIGLCRSVQNTSHYWRFSLPVLPSRLLWYSNNTLKLLPGDAQFKYHLAHQLCW
jgi:hypothetical protein